MCRFLVKALVHWFWMHHVNYNFHNTTRTPLKKIFSSCPGDIQAALREIESLVENIFPKNICEKGANIYETCGLLGFQEHFFFPKLVGKYIRIWFSLLDCLSVEWQKYPINLSCVLLFSSCVILFGTVVKGMDDGWIFGFCVFGFSVPLVTGKG